MKMCCNLKISLFLSLICGLMSANAVTSNSSAVTHFTGLLSDILETNRQHDLRITTLCDKELNSIQNGLNARDIWAIKRECFVFCEAFLYI